ncbi:hypothetical protein LCGC14_2905700, partial [marine sediment metagenome]
MLIKKWMTIMPLKKILVVDDEPFN